MKKQQIITWAYRVLAGLLGVSYLLTIFEIARTSIVPGKYLLPAVLVPGVIVGLLIYWLIRKKFVGVKRVLLVITSLLVIGANAYVYSVATTTSKFFGAIQEDGYSYIEYSIIAKKDRHVALGSGDHQTSLLSTDTNNDLVKTEVDKKTKTAYSEQPVLTDMAQAVSSNAADLAVLKSSYVDLLKENDSTFYSSVEVLATFTIKVKNQSAKTAVDTSKPYVVYISGIDTYGAISTVSRSDVNILMVVNPKTHKIVLVNTPRDYYVQLHGTTGLKDKLTHAGIYGVDMSEQTLEDLYSTQIDYYVRVNFASLTNIIDTIGGVSVFSDYTFDSQSYSFTTGYNQVDGKKALDFARTRYAFEDGDRQRGKNQQRVIEAIIRKLNNPSTLVNYQNIMKSLEGTFQTNAAASDIGMIINQQMDGARDWSVESISVDGAGATNYTYSMGAIPLYVMEPNQASLDSAKQKIQTTMNQ